MRYEAAPFGIDGRHIFPYVSQVPISLQTTMIQFLQQTTRTLPAVGDMQLAIDSSSTKPATDTVLTLVTGEPVWVATISNDQPIALFGIPALKGVLDNDMALAYRNSVDDLVMDAIDGATTNTRNQGTDTLVDAIHKAAQDVIDDGFSPKIVVLDTAQATVLGLLKDADDRYVNPFAADQPLGQLGLRPVVSPAGSATKAFVCDPAAIELYRSPVVFEVNTALGFKTNTAVARVEGLAKVNVRQGTGICELTYA